MKKIFSVLILVSIAPWPTQAYGVNQSMQYNQEATQKLKSAINALKAEEEVGSIEFLKTVDTLVTQGADPNVGREGAPDGLLIFLVSAPMFNKNLDRALQEKVVKNVLEHGANPNISSDRASAMHYAIGAGSSGAVIKLLIEHGVNLSEKSKFGKTPLEMVESDLQEQKDGLEYLQHKTVPNTQKNITRMRQILDTIKSLRNNIGTARNAIKNVSHYNQQATKQLQEKLNALKSEEETSNPEFLTSINQLITDGADPNTAFQGNKEVSLLMLLCKAPHWNDNVNFPLLEKVINAVLNAGADLNIQDGQGDTPLSHTLWIGSANTAKLLIEYGADPFKKDAQGQDLVTKLEQRLQMQTESAQHAFPTHVNDHQNKIRYLEQVRDILRTAEQKKS